MKNFLNFTGPVGTTPNLYRMSQPNVNGNSATVNGTQQPYGTQSMNHSAPVPNNSTTYTPSGASYPQNPSYPPIQSLQSGNIARAPPQQQQQQQHYNAALPGQINGPPQSIPPTNNAPWATPYAQVYQPLQAQPTPGTQSFAGGTQYQQQVINCKTCNSFSV